MRNTIFLVAASIAVWSAAGCSGSGGGSDPVSGHVVSGFGAPLAHAQVMVVGEDPVETDEDGRFKTDAADPYDLVVVDPGGGGVLLFAGVTDRTPLVIAPTNVSGSVAGTMTGTLTGGAGFPEPANLGYLTSFEPDDAEYFSGSGIAVDDQTGEYEAYISWANVPSATGRVSVLQYDASSSLPASYTGFGTVEGVSLEKGATTSNVSIALADVPEGTVSGTVTLPEGWQVLRYRLQLFQVLDGGSAAYFLGQFVGPLTTSTSFNLVTPAGDDFFVSAVVTARDPVTLAGARVNAYASPTTAGLVLDVPDPLVMTAPASDADSFSLSQPLSWEPTEHDGVFALALFGTGGGVVGDTVPHLRAWTDETSLTLPDLSPLGIDYGTGTRTLVFSASDSEVTVDDVLRHDPVAPVARYSHAPGGVNRLIEVTP